MSEDNSDDVGGVIRPERPGDRHHRGREFRRARRIRSLSVCRVTARDPGADEELHWIIEHERQQNRTDRRAGDLDVIVGSVRPLHAGGCDVQGLPRKAQALIAYLAMQPDRRVPREVVADLLWTRSGPEQVRHSLRQLLVVLRRTPAGDLVRVSADAIWIEAGTVVVDTLALESALSAGDDVALSRFLLRTRRTGQSN
jgi:hypothetical protein